MARRTKEQSAQTRARLIEAARGEFERRGYAHTTLEQIARAAGLTRGALYFHFADKASLFRAMRDEVELPLIDRIGLDLAPGGDVDPLAAIERFMLTVIATIGECETTRRTVEILSFGCEYVEALAPELDLQRHRHAELYERLLHAYRRARRQGLLHAGIDPALAALESTVFMSGLVRVWLLDRTDQLIGARLRALVRAHVASRRHSPARANGRRRGRGSSSADP
ncbi:MAG: TetR family transcriptional regulator [Burkholderiaceae bacterium]|nr:TetR family transcriptional regulator [Burkholderiaceae bacterium]